MYYCELCEQCKQCVSCVRAVCKQCQQCESCVRGRWQLAANMILSPPLHLAVISLRNLENLHQVETYTWSLLENKPSLNNLDDVKSSPAPYMAN